MEGSSPTWRELLQRSWDVPFFEQVGARVRSLSPGDRVIFSFLLTAVVAVSLFALYSLEQKMLIEIPSHGGSLVEGEIGSPQFINPLLAISDADRDLATLTYAGLLGLGANGTLVPVIAESYSVSDDGKTYTFVLRKNALFSDGTPITADDVVFTIHKAQNPSIKSPEYADWAGVTAMAVDTHTVRLTLTKSYAPFLGLTTLGILPSRLWQNVADSEFPFTTLETNPVGAGPFRVTNVSRDASGLIKSVSLAANPHYALGQPYLDRIQFKFYPGAEDLAGAVKSGAVESAYDLPTNRTSSRTLTAPYARVFGVFWNPSEKQVYARSEVRKALSLALDRSQLIHSVLGGYATPIMGPVPPGGGVTQTPVPVSNNPTLDAAKVLQGAGWTYDGTGHLWKLVSGKQTQTLDGITLRTSNVPELKGVASALKADWEKLGIPVDIELYEPGDLSQNVIRPRKYEALLYGMVIGRDQDLYAFWDSQERNDPGLNIASYVNKTVDALLEESRSSPDEKTRADDLQKIEDTVAADYPAAFVYAPDFTYTVPRDLQGVVLPQIITPADRFASVAKWYRVTDKVWPFFAK